MMIRAFVEAHTTLSQIGVSILVIYLILWFPRIIWGIDKILKELNKMNKNLFLMAGMLDENLKQGNNAKITSELVLKMLAQNKKEKGNETDAHE